MCYAYNKQVFLSYPGLQCCQGSFYSRLRLDYSRVLAYRKGFKQMATKLFVGKLSYNTTDSTLEAHFAQFGKVISAQVILDRDTRQSKGFGFVEMESEEEAKAAIAQLDGKELDGRMIVVSIARPREDRSATGGGNFQR
jgi:RNA recognition motif-containing protein